MAPKKDNKWLRFFKSKEVRAGCGFAALALQLFLQLEGGHAKSPCEITVQKLYEIQNCKKN